MLSSMKLSELSQRGENETVQTSKRQQADSRPISTDSLLPSYAIIHHALVYTGRGHVKEKSILRQRIWR